jgi:hypothetical protein
MRFIIQALIAGLLLGVAGLLIWQNPLPLSLTVLGTKLFPVALGILFVGAIGAGLLMGFLLLSLLPGNLLRLPTARHSHRSKASSQTRRATKANKFQNRNTYPSDWGEPISSDWSRGRREEQARGRFTEYDDRDPQAFDEEPFTPAERVVDADYRVIKPPAQPRRNSEWDDDFFDDEP